MKLDILSLIDLDIVVLICLIILLYVSKCRFKMDDKIKRLYSDIISITLIIICIEIADKIILCYRNPNLVFISKIINIIGFSIMPIVPYLLIKYFLAYFDINWKFKFLEIPIFINILICILTYKYKFVFSISSNNIYTRGPLFLVCIIITYYYFFVNIFIMHKNKNEIEPMEYFHWIAFETIPILVAIIQIIFKVNLLIWGLGGMVIILHFIFLQQQLLRYDNLTKVWNRITCELYISNNFINREKLFALIYIDIDEFKYINDTYGHNEGDVALINLAKFLRMYFRDIGKVARMGGDEFIVIVDKLKKVNIEDIVANINVELDKFNQKIDKKYNIKISIGYKVFNNDYLEISDYIKCVDKLMYENKKQNKINKKINTDN